MVMQGCKDGFCSGIVSGCCPGLLYLHGYLPRLLSEIILLELFLCFLIITAGSIQHIPFGWKSTQEYHICVCSTLVYSNIPDICPFLLYFPGIVTQEYVFARVMARLNVYTGFCSCLPSVTDFSPGLM